MFYTGYLLYIIVYTVYLLSNVLHWLSLVNNFYTGYLLYVIFYAGYLFFNVLNWSPVVYNIVRWLPIV